MGKNRFRIWKSGLEQIVTDLTFYLEKQCVVMLNDLSAVTCNPIFEERVSK